MEFLGFKEDIKQSIIHEILKNEKVMEDCLEEYKELPTKKIIQDIAVETFSVNIFKIIEDGYNSTDYTIRTDILFVYQKEVINRCKTYDISNIIKEMI